MGPSALRTRRVLHALSWRLMLAVSRTSAVLLGLTGGHGRLHTSRFSRVDELAALLRQEPAGSGLILGTHRLRHFIQVSPTRPRRELGNLLIVGPTRSGKGLLAVTQLLAFQHSVIVNDIKGELFRQTAGYRSHLGPVFVIDPTGIGNRYDPLAGKNAEDELFSAASHLLIRPGEGDGLIFTQRATVMLTQLFAAARAEGIPPLPYVRSLVRQGLASAAARLNHVSPELATQFLDSSFAEASLSDRFLLSSWGTLSARLRPLLTETVVRCFTGSDFSAEDLLTSERPVTIYLRWPEQDLLSLSPLIRLLWGSLIGELIAGYDRREGRGCQPVLLLIDEAGRTAIPTLADHATTVVGRGLSLWIAIQSLSQLEAVYGRARAQVLRDNMESQIYYRPTDLTTAQYLEQRLGQVSAYAHSETHRQGTETSEGRSERPIPLLTAQDILQLRDEEVIGFHRRLPPLRLKRADWRQHPMLRVRHKLGTPRLPVLPEVPDLSSPNGDGISSRFLDGYIDPDQLTA